MIKINIFHPFIVLATCLSLASCATGPTAEQLAQWEHERQEEQKKRESNTDIIVDFFVDEIWNKPLREVMKNSKKHVIFQGPSRRGIKKTMLPLIVDNTHRFDSEYTLGCNSDLANPRMIMAVVTDEYPERNYYKKKQQYNMKMGFNLKKFEKAPTHKYISKPTPGDKYANVKKVIPIAERGKDKCVEIGLDYDPVLPSNKWGGHFTATVKASEIGKKLLEKGVPLLYCHRRDYKSHENLYCTIDWHATNDNSKFIESFIIRTNGYKLMEFSVSELNVGKDEEHLSLSEIYYKRFRDPKKNRHGLTYAEMVRDFNIDIQKQLNQWNESAKAEQAIKDAENAAWHRKQQAKHVRAIGGISPDEPMNPYKRDKSWDKMEQTKRQAMDRINAAQKDHQQSQKRPGHQAQQNGLHSSSKSGSQNEQNITSTNSNGSPEKVGVIKCRSVQEWIGENRVRIRQQPTRSEYSQYCKSLEESQPGYTGEDEVLTKQK